MTVEVTGLAAGERYVVWLTSDQRSDAAGTGTTTITRGRSAEFEAR
jgi:hypothetical protein